MFLYSLFGNCQGKIQDNDSVFVMKKLQYLSLGLNSDIANNLIGIRISNGIDEKPIRHFEDITNNILYRFSLQTDIEDNYYYDGLIAWNTPSKRLLNFTVMLLGLDYSQRKIDDKIFQRKFNIISDIYLKQLRVTLVGKLGFNQINFNQKYGGEFGIRKSFRGVYFGSNFGYYSGIKTSFIYTECNIFKKSLYARLNYENIEDFNSLNVGLNYIFINNRNR